MDRLQSMRVFQRVVDEGGFAAAGRALQLSPAGITRFVGDLETHLGARLLQRTTRRLALTEAGETYLARVRTILQEIDEAEAAASASTRELRGTLRIVATPVLASSFLAPRVAAWRARHPGVVLEIVTDALPQARVEEFDLSFLIVDEGFDANVVARPLWRGEWVLCASPSYLARAGTPLVPADLERHEHLRGPGPQGPGQARKRLRLLPAADVRGALPVEVDAPAVLQSASVDVVYRAALEGGGIAVMSRLLVSPQFASGALVHLLPDWIYGRFVLFAAMPTRQLVPARARAFLDFIVEGSAETLPSML